MWEDGERKKKANHREMGLEKKPLQRKEKEIE